MGEYHISGFGCKELFVLVFLKDSLTIEGKKLTQIISSLKESLKETNGNVIILLEGAFLVFNMVHSGVTG